MKKFDIENYLNNSFLVNIKDVSFNSWNPKNKRTKEYNKVLESVKVNGLTMPIVVREIDNKDYKYEVLDGEQRLTACIDLGFNKIWVVNVGKISDEEAKAKTIWLEQSVPFDKKQLGDLLIELKDNVELPYSDEEIEVITGIAFDEDEDEEFIDNEGKLKSFSVFLSDNHIDKIKSEIKKLKDEYLISDGIALMIILDCYINGKRNENILNLISQLNEE